MDQSSTWNKFMFIFDKKQKLKAALLFLVIIIGAFVELVGVSAVLPFISAVLSPELILDNPWLGACTDCWGLRPLTSTLYFWVSRLFSSIYSKIYMSI